MRTGLVHDGHALAVLGRHAVLVGAERAVLEGAHRVQPRLAGAVDEAAVDPTRLGVDLWRGRSLVTMQGMGSVLNAGKR